MDLNDQKVKWDQFLDGLCDEARELAEKYPPWDCYEVVETKDHCHVIGIAEPVLPEIPHWHLILQISLPDGSDLIADGSHAEDVVKLTPVLH